MDDAAEPGSDDVGAVARLDRNEDAREDLRDADDVQQLRSSRRSCQSLRHGDARSYRGKNRERDDAKESEMGVS